MSHQACPSPTCREGKGKWYAACGGVVRGKVGGYGEGGNAAPRKWEKLAEVEGGVEGEGSATEGGTTAYMAEGHTHMRIKNRNNVAHRERREWRME